MSLDVLFQAIATKFTADRSDRIMKAERIKELAEEYASATDEALMDNYRVLCDLPAQSRGRPIGDIALAIWEVVGSLPEIVALEGGITNEVPAASAPASPSVPPPPPTPPTPTPRPDPARGPVLTTRSGPEFGAIRALGKPVLLYGGTPEPAKERFLTEACGNATWIGGDRSASAIAERVQNGAYSVVLIASGLVGHGAVKQLVDAAKAARVPFESVEKGGQGSISKALTAINARLATA